MMSYMRHLDESAYSSGRYGHEDKPLSDVRFWRPQRCGSVSLNGAIQIPQESTGGGGWGHESPGHCKADRLQAVLDLRLLPEARAQAAVDERPHPVDGLVLALFFQLAA